MRFFRLRHATRGTSDGQCAMTAVGCTEVGTTHVDAPEDNSPVVNSQPAQYMRGAVAGVVVIGVIVLTLVAGCVFLAARRRPSNGEGKGRRKRAGRGADGDTEASHPGDHELPGVKISTPASPSESGTYTPRLEYDIADLKTDPYKLHQHRYLTPDHLSIILERSGEMSDCETASARSAPSTIRF